MPATNRRRTQRKAKRKPGSTKASKQSSKASKQSSKASKQSSKAGAKGPNKREYRLVEQRNGETIITDNRAHNKGPGDAAVKLARPLFGDDRSNGVKVKLTITKVSPGRNQGAIYEYEVEQKHVPITEKDKNIPKNLVIESKGKKYRLKRYATKLKTYTPTMMKHAKSFKNRKAGNTGRRSKSVSRSDD